LTAALKEYEDYTALYEAAIATSVLMDDYQLANRKYGDNPPTKNLT
jgi:hypothetical protein